MCLILFSYMQHPDYPLIVAANRDEFYDRPSLGAHFWYDAPHILAGRDIQHGGSWLGVTRQGRFAALTNYRDPATLRSDALSRGFLVTDYLAGRLTPVEYIASIAAESNRYNGFNLLVGDRSCLMYYSNRLSVPLTVGPGIHGLSNHLLDTPWPKVELGRAMLRQVLDQGFNSSAFFRMLQDSSQPDDNQLPDTGVGLAWERVLAPIFIAAENYGTRAMTLVTFRRDGLVRFIERSRAESEEWLESAFQFKCE